MSHVLWRLWKVIWWVIWKYEIYFTLYLMKNALWCFLTNNSDNSVINIFEEDSECCQQRFWMFSKYWICYSLIYFRRKLLINVFYHLQLTNEIFKDSRIAWFSSKASAILAEHFHSLLCIHTCNNDIHIFLIVALGHDNTILTFCPGTDQLNWTP